MSLLKSVLPFLTNQAARFIPRAIGRSYFSGSFLLSFLLWYDFKILVKSRGGYNFTIVQFYVSHCLLTFGRSNFFHLKAKYPVFHFLDLDGTISNLIQPKINKKRQNFYRFLKVSLFYPLYEFGILVQIYQLII